MIVVVAHTERVPDVREPLFHVSSIRMMRTTAQIGPGLLTFVCLEEEWASATGGVELPIKNQRWPREN